MPPGDSAALAEALLAVLERPDSYTMPRDKIARVFDYERTVDLHEELYRSNKIVADDRTFELAAATNAASEELGTE